MTLKAIRFKLLPWMVVLIPLLIAHTQLYFYTYSDLSSWKGGGFGMYSEPHPNSSRSIWIEGYRDSTKTAFRLYPMDSRVNLKKIKSNDVRKLIQQMSAVAKKAKNFPSNTNFEVIQRNLNILKPVVLNKYKQLDFFPSDSVNYIVTQIQISKDYKNLESIIIHNSELWEN